MASLRSAKPRSGTCEPSPQCLTSTRGTMQQKSQLTLSHLSRTSSGMPHLETTTKQIQRNRHSLRQRSWTLPSAGAKQGASGGTLCAKQARRNNYSQRRRALRHSTSASLCARSTTKYRRSGRAIYSKKATILSLTTKSTLLS